MTQTIKPFADARRVPCRFIAGELCVSCGPDGDRQLTEGPPRASAPAPTFASPIERWFWEAHERLALPELAGLVPQHRITAGGRHYTLDFALVEQRVAFELDGYVWHSGRAAWAKDRRRDLALAVLGWRTYRFDGSLVRADAEMVVRLSAEIVRQASR